MKTHLLWLLAFVTIAFVACTTTAPHTPHTEEVKVLLESPKTPADHAAIAAHYEEDAKALREKAEEHKKILADFLKDPHDYPRTYLGGNFENHCNRLIELYTEAAEESLAMAKMHRQIAEGAR
jgi:hypothetical protein